MTRKRTIELSVINITMRAPHRPERYINLFRDAFSLNISVNLRGDWVGLLGEIKVENNFDESQIIRGEFFKYIDLEATRSWFSVRKRKRAEKEDLDSIIIPDDLKPHFQCLPFVFFSNGHRLVLISKDDKESLPPNQAARILSAIFNSKHTIKDYGKIEVVVEPARETLSKILGSSRLKKLDIEVTPPNSDDFHEFEEELYKEMDAQHAGCYRIILHEADNEGLIPNERIKNLARVAQSNGKVVGHIGSHGKSKILSTQDHPLIEKVDFYPNKQLRSEVLLTKAIDLLSRLKSKN
jgi:hypothetical protein